MRLVSQTLDANAEALGPFEVEEIRSVGFTVSITGTITVTLQRSMDGTTFVDVEPGYTSSVTKNVDGPGFYRLIASGVSGGSAICSLLVG
jgi:hypothetical protein